jgi:hypothetical protein
MAPTPHGHTSWERRKTLALASHFIVRLRGTLATLAISTRRFKLVETLCPSATIRHTGPYTCDPTVLRIPVSMGAMQGILSA